MKGGEKMAKMKFEVSYWPDQPGDPAFWVGFTATIEANSLEEARAEMYDKYGDCHPYLSRLNEAAKEAERKEWEETHSAVEPLPF